MCQDPPGELFLKYLMQKNHNDLKTIFLVSAEFLKKSLYDGKLQEANETNAIDISHVFFITLHKVTRF